MIMKNWLLVFLLWATQSIAQTTYPWPCEPKSTLNPTAPGGPWVEGLFSTGAGVGWWCRVPPPQGGDPALSWWAPYVYVGEFGISWPAMASLTKRVYDAPDKWAQIQQEMTANSTTPTPGSQAECIRKELLRQMCVVVQTQDFGPGYPAPKTSATNTCGPVVDCTAITPPPPPPEVWRTPVNGQYAMYNYNGVSTSLIVPKIYAPNNALCNCSLASVYSGASRYCALDGGVATKVAYCQKK